MELGSGGATLRAPAVSVRVRPFELLKKERGHLLLTHPVERLARDPLGDLFTIRL